MYPDIENFIPMNYPLPSTRLGKIFLSLGSPQVCAPDFSCPESVISKNICMTWIFCHPLLAFIANQLTL
jgi:hypothetical protein